MSPPYPKFWSLSKIPAPANHARKTLSPVLPVIYTPAVCYSALALAVLPPVILMLTGGDAQWGTWIYRALTFLVTSCPCALVVSIPLSFFAGIGGASKEGVLVKGSNYLETLSQVRLRCIR